MKKFIWLILITLIVATAALVWLFVIPVKNPKWEQPTMGTMAHITISGPVLKQDLKQLHAAIDAALEDVNNTLSTWQENSEISTFNRFRGSEGFPITREFRDVTRRALQFSEWTDGLFDPTVKPLVDHFGFGPEQQKKSLDEIMKTVGWEKLVLSNAQLRKRNPYVQLDFSAIAKGYGVDRVADVIAQTRSDFLVEIGGEIVARGLSPSGNPWHVGIENPDPNSPFGQSVFRELDLSNLSMATSGDYRNFQTREDGTLYSHIIDPKTGEPAESDVAAVTVLADRCMDADAVATALFVMGSEKGLQWLTAMNNADAESIPHLEALFILHSDDEPGFDSCATPGFPAQ